MARNTAVAEQNQSAKDKDFDLARSWMRQSLVRANTHTHTPLLPTRVLDLNPELWKSQRKGIFSTIGNFRRLKPPEQHVQLTCPKAGSRAQYLTLSHRWGGALVTTKETIKSHCKQISFTCLPKTFRDAVVVARQLGYRYLWIDSLCIIQDDEQDWLHESALMADIYQNAACTIAAHSAKDDSHGFLKLPNALGKVRGSMMASPRSNFRAQVNNSPLSLRGWVFQERILSTRILHFVDSHLFFEDQFGVQADDGSTENPDLYSPWIDGRIPLQDVVGSTIYWYPLIERYTLCSLTFESDRLQAIAGLARHVQSHWKDAEYCYGIWMDSLQLGLLWLSRDKSLQSPSYTAPNLPPSWSWAHWEGPVQYPKSRILKARFEFVGVTGFSDNTVDMRPEFGPSDGRYVLCLRALKKSMSGLKLGQLRNYETLLRKDGMGRPCAWIRSAPTSQVAFVSTLHGLFEIGASTSEKCIGWISIDSGATSDIDLSNLSCILVASHEDTKYDMYDDDTIDEISEDLRYFLLLARSDHRPHLYKRVGMGAFMEPRWVNDAKMADVRIE